YGTLPSRRALKNSRLVSQKDDVHLCIMCLRAIMNYQYGFNLVMSHPHAVNEIALSLNNKNPRTKALVLELLAAVCLVRGGHEIILAAFDNFKEVRGDLGGQGRAGVGALGHQDQAGGRHGEPQGQTGVGDQDPGNKSRHTESEKLQVQIQAYLDNVFDVGGLLEDAETKNVALEKVEELEEHLSHLTEKLLDLENENMMRVAELEKQLLQREKELEVVKVRGGRGGLWGAGRGPRPPPSPPDARCPQETYERTSHQGFRTGVSLVLGLSPGWGAGGVSPKLGCPHWGAVSASSPPTGKCPPAPPLPGASPSIALTVGLSAIRIKKPIKTKFRLPVFNWTALKPTQISGTVFGELDDERVLEGCQAGLRGIRSPRVRCRGGRFDLATVPVDFVECLMRFVPTEAEARALRQYERERKALEELADEDRFMLHFSKVERLPQRMAIMAFLGNFAENLQMLTPVRSW
ncbi:FMNL3 protein, partial [Podargus strigoides]|nr:FMNL3 protein [Podargus strigoides]